MEITIESPSVVERGAFAEVRVIKLRKKKKKKKDTRASRVIDRIVLGGNAAMGQMARSLGEATDKYKRKRRRSKDKKRRNAASRDLGKNLSSASAELFKGSAKAPSKFAEALWKKDKKKKKKKQQRREREAREVLTAPLPVDVAPPL